MRLIQLILFTLFFHYTSAQPLFKGEQKISQSKDLEFEEISFTNTEDGLQLSGTLIYPIDGYEKIIMIVP